MSLVTPASPAGLSLIRRIQLLTVTWMAVKVSIAMIAAARAHSVALLAFGGDSAIEFVSALVVYFRFTGTRLSERAAARSAAILLFALAPVIVSISILSLSGLLPPPEPSYLGIGLLLAAAAIMPSLAAQKRKIARETGSSAMAADAAQSSVCAWLAWIAMAGLVLNSEFKISWADPVAALALIPMIVKEGRDAWQEKACRCC